MPTKVALWQGKPAVDSMAQLSSIATEAAASGVDLLVLPELFLGGYDLEGIATRAVSLESPTLHRASDIAKQHGLALVFGFPEALTGPDGQPQVCDTVVAIDADGVRCAVYRKTHLFGTKEKGVFTPGSDLGKVFSLAGLRIGLLICYDVEFPEATRALALNGAELILVPTANYTPYDYVNEKLVPCRAFENHVHVAYVNWAFGIPGGESFNGRSVLADPQGEFLLQFGGEECCLKHATLQGRTTGPAEGLEDNYLLDRRPELYQPITAEHVPKDGKALPKLLIVSGVTGALGNAVLGQAVQCPDTVVYGFSRQALPWQRLRPHGSAKLPATTLVASLGAPIEDEAAIRGFVEAIDFSKFSAVWYCHAVGIMPFEVDDHGKHLVSHDHDNDGIDDRVLNLTGLAFPRMAQALAKSTPLPVAVLSFGALSDVWEVTVHGSWVKAMKTAKASLAALVKVHENLSGCTLNISSVACAHEILTRPYVCAQTHAKLNFWLSPWEVAAKTISVFRSAKGGVLSEEDFFHALPRFDAAAYYSNDRFTQQKMLELYQTEPGENGCLANGCVPNGCAPNGCVTNGSTTKGAVDTMPNGDAVPNGCITNGSTPEGAVDPVPNGCAPNGCVTNGSTPKGAVDTVPNGCAPNGCVTNGSTPKGAVDTVPNGCAPNGCVANGSTPKGAVDAVPNGCGPNGCVTNGSAAKGAVTSAADAVPNGCVPNGCVTKGSAAKGAAAGVADPVPNGCAPNGCVTNGSAAKGATASVADTVAYYEMEKVQANYHACWGKDNMHVGLFPHVEDAAQPVIGMELAAHRLTSRMAELLGLTASSKLLDLGCGFGQTLEQVVGLSGCQGVGLDVTPRLIEAAQARVNGNSSRLHFVVGSYLDLLESVREHATFTHVLSIQALLYGYDHIDEILSQLRRVLAPGARFCMSEYVGVDGEISQTMRRNFYERVRLNPLLSRTKLRAALTTAGFTIEHEETCDGHAQEGYKQLAAMARQGGCTSPDGSALADAYEKTSACIAEGQLGLVLLVAHLPPK